LPEDFGVTLRTDEKVRDVEWRGKVLTVSLDSGEVVEAAGVVVCVGSQLDLTWLEGSGLELDGGVVVDEHLQASANVAALGDVARFAWPGPLGVEMLRIEHWEVAVFHAAQLARYWTQGVGPERVMVPYFWSDQYGKKIQMLGHPRPDDEVTLVHGDVASKQWLALYARDEIVTGLLALSSPRPLMLAKVVLDEVTSRDHALERAPWRV
ncbi:MAG TPA: oxidoreductase C-terminal domain-containing protein, partial [Acidimicrobiales bacterium]|nr:oxidoreductase C-terminal domain-containing protein [Acidimicrobiales bacterium]